MNRYLVCFFLLLSSLAFSQETPVISGEVLNAANDIPIDNAHIINLNLVEGTVSDAEGNFEIKARVNDTLYFSHLGFKPIRVRVTNDWMKFGDVKVKMTEIGYALEEIVLTPVPLTGFLEIDARNVPVYDDFRYRISGLTSGYEGGDTRPGAVSKVLGAIFNPADVLYNIFGKKPQNMRKLREMKEDDAIRNLLQKKYDRETLMALLQVSKVDIDEILRRCNYSQSFIENANDLQILDAISGCYEEYKVLH